ncbi:MAG: hypothetical protein K9N35_04700 [Candidatus Marinimicrobia bacterium]|nr:hypothetical protein [Candidatus Neomarinimicrobiota bacterium]
MIRFLSSLLILIILTGCSSAIVTRYEKGDHFTRSFQNMIQRDKKISGAYYEVERNKKKQIIAVKHFSGSKQLMEKSYYEYASDGSLSKHHYVEYFDKGKPRFLKEWTYNKNIVTQREEQWFTRSRTLEKKLIVFYDKQGKPYLEQTEGLGDKIESSTEYYYDYKNRLDKSRRNFFLLDGGLRDYWLTIYNDDIQIMTEEHYYPDNSLITFYRYTYHPVKGYREREEILDADRNLFISRTFDAYGLVQQEEERDRQMNLQKRRIYEYTDKHQPKFIHHYNSKAELIKTEKYHKPQYLEAFRTPGT